MTYNLHKQYTILPYLKDSKTVYSKSHELKRGIWLKGEKNVLIVVESEK